MKLTKEECETVILGNAASQVWDITTADPRIMRYLVKRGYASKLDDTLGEPYLRFIVPFGRLRFLKPEKRAVKAGLRPPRRQTKRTDTVAVEAVAINVKK